MFNAVEGISSKFRADVVKETSSKIRTFLYELAEETTYYKSLHNLTEQVEHQYHGRFLIELIQNAHDAISGQATAWEGSEQGQRMSDHNGVMVDLHIRGNHD